MNEGKFCKLFYTRNPDCTSCRVPEGDDYRCVPHNCNGKNLVDTPSTMLNNALSYCEFISCGKKTNDIGCGHCHIAESGEDCYSLYYDHDDEVPENMVKYHKYLDGWVTTSPPL